MEKKRVTQFSVSYNFSKKIITFLIKVIKSINCLRNDVKQLIKYIYIVRLHIMKNSYYKNQVKKLKNIMQNSF